MESYFVPIIGSESKQQNNFDKLKKSSKIVYVFA